MTKAKTIRTIPQQRTPMRKQEPALRLANLAEVASGYSFEDAVRESERCLMCADEPCVAGCPVGVDIPGFIRMLTERNYRGAYDVLTDTNLLPAICGRVCPQESQCEKVCTVAYSLEAVAIGRLERFVGDTAISEGWINTAHIEPNRLRVGIVGSGPAGMACAADMARAGCQVTVYDALAEPGGVLRYGIPGFRLPKEVIDAEIDMLKQVGVRFECNTAVGRRFTVEQMIAEMGFDAVFVGVGAGSPTRLKIPGDGLNGVLPASELLTCGNAMGERDYPDAGVPQPAGRRIVIVGASNAALDAARLALRLGAQKVVCIDRRSRSEAPARAEEIRHAEQEGVEFLWLTRPLSILDDGKGNARAIRCERLDADDAGPGAVATDDGIEIDAELILYSIGTAANPVIGASSKLKLDQRGYIEASETLTTSLAGVFAGGDIVTGGATVIEAMGAGRRAARSMMDYLGIRDAMRPYLGHDDSRTLFGIDTEERNFARARIAARPPGEHPAATDQAGLQPALFAGFRELATLRHDFPLVLLADCVDEAFAQPLSAIIDQALATAARGSDIERIRKHVLRLEQEIRSLVCAGETGSLFALWDLAASRLPKGVNQSLPDSLRRARAAIRHDGELANCDAALPGRLLWHAWSTVERRKAGQLHRHIDGLRARLTAMLEGQPDRSAHERERLSGLLDSLRAQPPLSTTGRPSQPFDNYAEALDALRQTMPQWIEAARTMALAEIEIAGKFSESAREALFARFDATGLDAQELALFPGVLVCLDAAKLAAEEHGRLLEALSSGLPIKLLLQIDDILDQAPDGGSEVGCGMRARQITLAAIELDSAFVIQSASSGLVRCSESLLRALDYGGPALFSVFSGASGLASGLPAYLVSATAMESRAFPAFSYEPSTAPDAASHLCLDANPQVELDWPVHRFDYEDEQHQRASADIAFTWADFVAGDRRYSRQLTHVSREQWNEHMICVSETLANQDKGLADTVPTLLMVDAGNGLHKVTVSRQVMEETRRCRDMWRHLREWKKS